MKKLFKPMWLILTAISLFSLCSCGKSNEEKCEDGDMAACWEIGKKAFNKSLNNLDKSLDKLDDLGNRLKNLDFN